MKGDLQHHSLHKSSADPTSLFGSPTTAHTKTDFDNNGYNNDLPSLSAPEFSNYLQASSSQYGRFYGINDEYEGVPMIMLSQHSYIGMNHSLNYSLYHNQNHPNQIKRNNNNTSNENKNNSEPKCMTLGFTYFGYTKFNNNNSNGRKQNNGKAGNLPHYTLQNYILIHYTLIKFALPAYLQMTSNFYNNTNISSTNLGILNNEANQHPMLLNPNYCSHKHSTSDEEHDNNNSGLLSYKSQTLWLYGNDLIFVMIVFNLRLILRFEVTPLGLSNSIKGFVLLVRGIIFSSIFVIGMPWAFEYQTGGMSKTLIFSGGTADEKPSSQHRHHHIHIWHDKHTNNNNNTNNNGNLNIHIK